MLKGCLIALAIGLVIFLLIVGGLIWAGYGAYQAISGQTEVNTEQYLDGTKDVADMGVTERLALIGKIIKLGEEMEKATNDEERMKIATEFSELLTLIAKDEQFRDLLKEQGIDDPEAYAKEMQDMMKDLKELEAAENTASQPDGAKEPEATKPEGNNPAPAPVATEQFEERGDFPTGVEEGQKFTPEEAVQAEKRSVAMLQSTIIITLSDVINDEEVHKVEQTQTLDELEAYLNELQAKYPASTFITDVINEGIHPTRQAIKEALER